VNSQAYFNLSVLLKFSDHTLLMVLYTGRSDMTQRLSRTFSWVVDPNANSCLGTSRRGVLSALLHLMARMSGYWEHLELILFCVEWGDCPQGLDGQIWYI